MGSPYRLMTDGRIQPKLVKAVPGRKRPILSAAFHLSPADSSGFEVCGGRSIACTAGCLGWTGHGGIGVERNTAGHVVKGNSVTAARERRTVRLFEDPEATVETLTRDLSTLSRRAADVGADPAARLNATSDLDWTSIFGKDGTTLLDRFPRLQFYDYTKVRERYLAFLAGELPPNYHLTYSRSETLASGIFAMQALEAGGTVAVVFDTPKGAPLPRTWNGHRVIDGRAHDYRFLDPQGVVVGLSALGKDAKRDVRGFVVRVRQAYATRSRPRVSITAGRK